MEKHEALPVDQQYVDVPSATVHAARAAYRRSAIAMHRSFSALLCCVLLVVMAWARSVHVEAMNSVPLIVGLTPDGATRILPPHSVLLNPEDMEPAYRYFLLEWAKNYFSRLPSGYLDYERSRLFMDQRLAGAQDRSEARDQIKRVSEGQQDEVFVSAQIVTFETPLQNCPETPGKRCRAYIDAQKIIRPHASDQAEVRQIKIRVEFSRLNKVPAETVRENPLGFVVTDFHVSEAVK